VRSRKLERRRKRTRTEIHGQVDFARISLQSDRRASLQPPSSLRSDRKLLFYRLRQLKEAAFHQTEAVVVGRLFFPPRLFGSLTGCIRGQRDREKSVAGVRGSSRDGVVREDEIAKERKRGS
jgi:hypothetical protein